jgi:outer membrane protein TolC
MNAALAITLAATLTFPAALEKAMRTRAAATTYDDRARTLEALPFRTMPVVRAETGISSAENLNLLNESTGRIDAFTALVHVDYPLFGRGAEERRMQAIRADAQILRRRALDEAEDVFRETLEAFADLYVTERRMELLTDGARRAAQLRERARTMLDAGQISNVTAAQWQDQALATESQLVELELQRLEAETRLKQLIGDTSGETLHASLEISDAPMLKEIRVDRIVEADTAVARAALIEQRKRLALQETMAAQRPQFMLSAFGGMAAVPTTHRSDLQDGAFGVYGLRLSMSFPLLDTAAARRLAEARIEAEEAARVRSLTATATRNRIDLLWLAVAAADRRIELLTEAVNVARRREESVTRLVTAGVRPESDLVDAAAHVAKRESDLLAVRVDRWKLQQRVKWSAGSGSLEQRASSPIGGQ